MKSKIILDTFLLQEIGFINTLYKLLVQSITFRYSYLIRFFFYFSIYFFQENNLLKVSFMVMAGFNASEGSYQCEFSTTKEMETLDLFVTGEV